MKLSKCHNAPVYVHGSSEGTNYYVCTECSQPCDAATKATIINEEDMIWEAATKAERQRLREQMEVMKGPVFPGNDTYPVVPHIPSYNKGIDDCLALLSDEEDHAKP